jgi:hypothetical protein
VGLLVLVHDLGELDCLVGDVATSAALCIGCQPTSRLLAAPPVRPPILPIPVLRPSLAFCLPRD